MSRAVLMPNPSNSNALHGLLVREFNHPSIFGILAEEWDAVSARSSLGSPFLTALWNQLWWNHWHRDRRLKLLALYEAGGELCGVAPLCAGPGAGDALSLLGSPDVCDFRDFTVVGGAEARFYEVLIAYLRSQSPRRMTLTLSSLKQHSPTFSFFTHLARCQDYQIHISHEDTAPCMHLPSDFQTYLNRLPAKERHEIRRKKRRAEKEGMLVFECISDTARIMAAMPSFLHLFRLSGGVKSSFLTPEREAFFLSLAEAFSGRGWLNLYALSLNGSAIAYLFCFVYHNALYLYNAAYDSRFAQLSPGIVAIALCIEDAIGRGIRRFEFLRGNEAYKYRFGGLDHHVYTLTCSLRGE